MTIIWLIGSCPSHIAYANQPPLRTGRSGSTAERLCQMLEMSLDDYEAAFERANILGAPPWSDRRSRLAGRRVRAQITDPAVVLGRDPWKAMALPNTSRYFETVENFTLVPHPSGRSLVYNNASIRAKLKETIDALRKI